MSEGWVRAGHEVRAARIDRGFKTLEEFAAACDISASSLDNIEHGRRASYRPATLAAVERTLEWAAGSITRIVEGGHHRRQRDPEFERVRTAWPYLDLQARRMLAAHAEAALGNQ